MSLRAVLVLSLVVLAHGPCDGGIILDKITSLVNKFVPLPRGTTTALPPTAPTSTEDHTTAAANHSAGDASSTASELSEDNSTLPVTTLPDDLTTISSNNSQPKGMIFAPNLAKCSSGFRTGKNGRCYKIV